MLLQISRRFSIAVTLGICLGSSACQQSNTFNAPKDDKGKKGDKKDAKGNDDESVDVPSNIVGSYLICALRKNATATDLASDYGCRLNDASTDTQLDISAALQSIRWGSNISGNVIISQPSPIAVWHAIYTVNGPTVESIQDTVSRLNIRVDWVGAGESSILLKEQPIVDVLRPISSTGDTAAPILQGGIDPKDPGI